LTATGGGCVTVPKPCAGSSNLPGHLTCANALLKIYAVNRSSAPRLAEFARLPGSRTGSQCNEKRPSAVVDRGRTKLPVAEAAGVEAAALIDDMADDGWRAA